MGIGPCILMKVFCALFMGKSKWVIGWAMVGRAEFAYFIAIMAKSLKMMDDDLFAVLIWSLIYATIFAPLIFRCVLRRFVESQKAIESQVDDHNPTPSVIATLERQISDASTDAVKHQTTFGHLPDLYGEKLEQDKKAKLAAAESVLEQLESAKREITRLRALVDENQVAAATKAGSDAKSADSMRMEVAL